MLNPDKVFPLNLKCTKVLQNNSNSSFINSTVHSMNLNKRRRNTGAGDGTPQQQQQQDKLTTKNNNNTNNLGVFINLVHNNSPPSPPSPQSPPLQPPGSNCRWLRSSKQRHRSYMPDFYDVYQLTDEVLGRGSSGLVCRCVHKRSKAEYAVKMINKDYVERSRVRKECDDYFVCRPCKQIIDLHEFYEDENYYYLVFELMKGGHLLKQIESRGRLTEREASRVAKQVALALDYIHHRGLAHRDVKPENILCVNANELFPVKICDFDLAGSGSTLPGMTVGSVPPLSTPVGTTDFMAPEVVNLWLYEEKAISQSAPVQAQDGMDSEQREAPLSPLFYDKQCDMWSFGVLIYTMLCGYTPFRARCNSQNCGWQEGMACETCRNMVFAVIQSGAYEFPDAEWRNISFAAKDLISKLLVRDSKKRYTASDVLNHPWIEQGGFVRRTNLQTARILIRDNSADRLGRQATDALSIMKRFDARKANFNRMKELGIYPVVNNKTPVQVTPATQSQDTFSVASTDNHHCSLTANKLNDSQHERISSVSSVEDDAISDQDRNQVQVKEPDYSSNETEYSMDIFPIDDTYERTDFTADLTFVRSDLALDLTSIHSSEHCDSSDDRSNERLCGNKEAK
ncbi:hypothetical protein ACOME3_006821 [Neoechinorhynchus agilis]